VEIFTWNSSRVERMKVKVDTSTIPRLIKANT
jgi:hypothetical protein